MLESLLIANRGEIARRIIRTARRLGVRTIAVYSQADQAAAHVREADVAVAIGPAPARDSYLVTANLLAAARQTGAAAIHPGYGFLSENADFAAAVLAEGLTWIGPPPEAIQAMGRKDAAKALMAAAGVPVTPGYYGEDQSTARLQAAADAIGYPVLIKAVAGGGGKGMRRVDQAGSFAEALASCRREALASFGDDRVLLETYIRCPRHIEVQIFGDTHGQVVHLFERDCSLQRRHQKVIEEAPAPGMDEETRAAVTQAAVKAARAVGYQGAGTVEFIADASDGLRSDRIWFMEMNTRLQVEHPVTEMVTGLDLVEWQIRVASGEPLPCAQEDLRLNGHAIEARLYAENPASGFLPSIGRLDHLRLPTTIRVDAGVEEGDEVTSFYDPMIAKLIAHAEDRPAALEALASASAAVEAWPVKTNAGFLTRCLTEPEFVAGAVDTGFIERRGEPLTAPPTPSTEALSAVATAILTREGERLGAWRGLQGFRQNAAPDPFVRVFYNDEAMIARADPACAPRSVRLDDDAMVVFDRGEALVFTERAPKQDMSEGGTEDRVRSPMPGRVAAVTVAVGDKVAKGQALIVVEAMKMEHTLGAPLDGVVAELTVKLGDQVAEGDLLIVLTPLEADG